MLSSAPSFLARAAALAYDRLILQPLLGVLHLATGVGQTVGPLLCAAWRAVIGIVHLHLSPDDQEAAVQGIDRMKVGVSLLAWPLALLGGLLLWRAPLVVQALFAVSTLSLVMG